MPEPPPRLDAFPARPYTPNSMRALASLVAVVLAACSSSAPAVDASGEVAIDAPADAADEGDVACTLVSPYSSKNAVCNGCAATRCCAEVNGCLGDPRCNDDYVNCILACSLLPADAGGDASGAAADCLAKCASDFPAGKAAYDTAIGCVDPKCATECG